MRIALCIEFNHDYDAAAKAAVERGLYSKNTVPADIAAGLSRSWLHRNRPQGR